MPAIPKLTAALATFSVDYFSPPLTPLSLFNKLSIGLPDSVLNALCPTTLPAHSAQILYFLPIPSFPSSTNVDELKVQSATWRRKAIRGESPELDAEQQKDLHEASLAEVSKGHLHGPLEEHQVSAALGSDQWLFSPRFAVYQGEEGEANR